MLKLFLKVKYFINKGNKNVLILLEKSLVIVIEYLNKKYSVICIIIYYNVFKKYKLFFCYDIMDRIKLFVLYCILYICMIKIYFLL